MDAARGRDRDLAHRLRCAERQGLEERPRISHRRKATTPASMTEMPRMCEPSVRERTSRLPAGVWCGMRLESLLLARQLDADVIRLHHRPAEVAGDQRE